MRELISQVNKHQFAAGNGVLLTGLFLYVKFGINPVLYWQWQQPVFYSGNQFFRKFTDYPGGLTEYAAGFIGQFFRHSWAGALIVALSAALICLLTHFILKMVSEKNGHPVLALIPAVPLLMMHHFYKHPFTLNLGLIMALGFYSVYLRLSRHTAYVRLLYILTGFAALYYLAAGFAFVFVMLCSFSELRMKNGFKRTLFLLPAVFLLPYIGLQTLFIVSLRDAYVYLLPVQLPYQVVWAPYLLMLLILLLPFVNVLTLLFQKIKPPRQGLFRKTASVSKSRWVQTGFLVLITAAAVLMSVDFDKKIIITVDYYAGQGNWDQVLQTVDKDPAKKHWLIDFHKNRALCHQGRLLDDLFSYTQHFGMESLLLPNESVYFFPMQNSDLFFELGYLNEAQHWAHEALSIKGDIPASYQRLALVNIMKRQVETAQTCFNILKKNNRYTEWVNQHEPYIHDSDLFSRNKKLVDIYRRRMRGDLLAYPGLEQPNLQGILSSSRNNKMAFEYLIASYLLTVNLNQLPRYIPMLKRFRYQHLPRHFEEALLLSAAKSKMNLMGYKISQRSRMRFQSFNQILAAYRGDSAKIARELKRHHQDTYWYYVWYQNQMRKRNQ